MRRTYSIFISAFLLVNLISLRVSAAWSELDATEEMCRQDVSTLCPNAGQDVTQMANCLRDHDRELSRGCLDWMEYNTHMRGTIPTECIADSMKLNLKTWLSRSHLEDHLKNGSQVSPSCLQGLNSNSVSDTRVVVPPSFTFLRNSIDTLAILDKLDADHNTRKDYSDVMVYLTARYKNDREDKIRKAEGALRIAGDSIEGGDRITAEKLIHKSCQAVLLAENTMISTDQWPNLTEQETSLLTQRIHAFFGDPVVSHRPSISGCISDLRDWLAAPASDKLNERGLTQRSNNRFSSLRLQACKCSQRTITKVTVTHLASSHPTNFLSSLDG